MSKSTTSEVKEEIKEEVKPEATSGYVAEEPKAAAPEDKIDDYGYTTGDEPEKEEVAEEKKPEEKKEEVKEPDPVSGYQEEPKVAKEEEKPKEEAPEPKEELDFKDIDEEDTKLIKAFAEKNKLSKDAVKAMIELKKEEYKALDEYAKAKEKEAKENKLRVQKQWFDELKNDSTFGGEKFAYHIKQVDKVINEFMPGLKSELAKSKTMLPPYAMRDFAKLAKHLYATEKLTQGEKVVEDKKVEEDDHLAFYR